MAFKSDDNNLYNLDNHICGIYLDNSQNNHTI